jgi:uncharacterized protein (TIGR02444 family)
MARRGDPDAAALWRYALRLYGRPGVERACLGLHEGWGADVNLLLFCCWLESRGIRAGLPLLRRAVAAVAPWREQVILPLRNLRRCMKPGLAGVPAASSEAVRGSVRAAELAAERVELALLAACVPPAERRMTSGARLGGDGLERYRRLLGMAPGGEGLRHLETLRAAAAGLVRGGTRPRPVTRRAARR